MEMLKKRSREDGADVEAQAMANCLMLLAARMDQNSSSSLSSKDLCSFQCKTCDKKFPSFQALGGHRASHKRPKLQSPPAGEQDSLFPDKAKMHRCSICGVKFSMGQALGGHMRRHRAAMEKSPPVALPKAAAVPVLKRTTSSKRVFGFELDLDLNLAPPENIVADFKLGSRTKTAPVLHCFI